MRNSLNNTLDTALSVIAGMAIVLGLMLLTIKSSEAADISFYRGLYTAHIGVDLNNDNDLLMLRVNNVVAGTMVNSYNNRGYLLGVYGDMYRGKDFTFSGGLIGISGYKRWQLPVTHRQTGDLFEEVLVALPVVSVEYRITDGVSLQATNMGGIVINAGIKLNIPNLF